MISEFVACVLKTKLTDKVSSDIVLWKAGLPSLNEAVSSSMASLIWKARNQMNPLGHSEAASNNLAKLWNTLDLKSAKSVTAAKMLAKKHFKAT